MTRLVRSIILLALFAPLISHIYLGQFNRAMADDFCFTAIVREQGIGGALDHWYNNWTGTYSSTFFQSLVGLAHAWRWVPVVLIILWLLAAVWTAYQIVTVFQLKQRNLIALVMGSLLVYAANDGTANVYQSLYWTSGAITYTLPLIILTFNLGVIVLLLHTSEGDRLPLSHLTLSAGLCMMAGGFSPLFAVFQVVLFGLLVFIVWWFAPLSWKKQALVVLGVNAVFALIALGILYFSPGNAIRRNEFQLELSFLQIVFKTIEGSLAYIVLAFARLSPLIFLATGFTAYLLGLHFRPVWTTQFPLRILRIRARRWFGLMVVGGLMLIAAAVLTSVASINLFPPPRAYIIPHTVLVLLVFAGGYLIGITRIYNPSSERLPIWSALAIFALVMSSVVATNHTLVFASQFAVFAQEWDDRDAYIRAIATKNPQSEVVVQDFTVDFADYAGVLKLEPIAAGNICVADYYGVKSIRVSR